MNGDCSGKWRRLRPGELRQMHTSWRVAPYLRGKLLLIIGGVDSQYNSPGDPNDKFRRCMLSAENKVITLSCSFIDGHSELIEEAFEANPSL